MNKILRCAEFAHRPLREVVRRAVELAYSLSSVTDIPSRLLSYRPVLMLLTPACPANSFSAQIEALNRKARSPNYRKLRRAHPEYLARPWQVPLASEEGGVLDGSVQSNLFRLESLDARYSHECQSREKPLPSVSSWIVRVLSGERIRNNVFPRRNCALCNYCMEN